MTVAAFIVLCGLAALIVRNRLQRRWTLRLNWPKDVSYHKFNRLTNTYLIHHGWTINNRAISQHLKIVKRGNDRVVIYCLCAADYINRSKVRDLAIEAMSQKPPLLVCITSGEVPEHLNMAAAAGNVLIVSYQALAVFGTQETGQFATFNAMRAARLERVTVPR